VAKKNTSPKNSQRNGKAKEHPKLQPPRRSSSKKMTKMTMMTMMMEHYTRRCHLLTQKRAIPCTLNNKTSLDLLAISTVEQLPWQNQTTQKRLRRRLPHIRNQDPAEK